VFSVVADDVVHCSAHEVVGVRLDLLIDLSFKCHNLEYNAVDSFGRLVVAYPDFDVRLPVRVLEWSEQFEPHEIQQSPTG